VIIRDGFYVVSLDTIGILLGWDVSGSGVVVFAY